MIVDQIGGLPRGAASDGVPWDDAAERAVEVPVPDDECGLVLADSYRGRMLAAVVEPTETQPSASASGFPTPAAASMVDLKGLARPEPFDGSDDAWLDWKYGFRNVMTLLDITPFLDLVEGYSQVVDQDAITPRERQLG